MKKRTRKKNAAKKAAGPSMHSFLVHGRSHTASWDFSHHVVPPLSSSSTFRLASAERGALGFREYAADDTDPDSDPPIFIYDRLEEPTRAMLESRLAKAEGGGCCVCYATGMAAIAAAFGVLLRSGDEILCHETVYGCTHSLLTEWLPKLGITTRFVDLRQPPSRWKRKINRKTRAVYFETPVNPTMDLIDIQAVADAAHAAAPKPPKGRRPLQVIVDNTFATPFCQRPLELGADVVVASLTKNICGFGTDMGGAVIAGHGLRHDLMMYRKDFGGALASKSAWPILVYGLPSLGLRVRHEERNALDVARFLQDHPLVREVRYPGLDTFPQTDLARRQMRGYRGGFAPGSMIYFTLKGNRKQAEERARRMVNQIARHGYTITLAVSLGQIRTLIEQPAAMTHAHVPKKGSRIPPHGIRLSVGIEEVHDIIADLERGLKAAGRA